MTFLNIGKNNMISLLSTAISGVNFVDTFQSAPKQATYPSISVTAFNLKYEPHVQEYVTLKMGSGTTLESYWGLEKCDITVEIVHNNRILRDAVMETLLSLFIVNGSVIKNSSVFGLESYRIMDSSKEVINSNWFSLFHFNSYSPMTFAQNVYRMDTIELELTATEQPL